MRHVARVTLLIAYDQHDRSFTEDDAEKIVDAIHREDGLVEAVVESCDPHFADAPMIDTSSWTDYGYEYDAELAPEWWTNLVAPFVAEWLDVCAWYEAERRYA